MYVCVCVCVQGIKFGTNIFVVSLSVMQNLYRHKRWIVRAKTNRSLENQKRCI